MALDYKDYYRVLGVARNATEDQIRQAFRRLAREYHPDVAKDKRSSEEKFKEINEAYEVLGDTESRARYDSLGAGNHSAGSRAGPRQRHRSHHPQNAAGGYSYSFGGAGFSDFFEHIFGRTRGEDHSQDWQDSDFNGSTSRNGEDIKGTIVVTLEEVLRGSIRNITINRVQVVTGKKESMAVRVRIPAGVETGQIIRIPGQGGLGFGRGRSGDVLLKVRIAKHPDFKVRGKDLYMDLNLSPWEAVLGAVVSVSTLDGTLSLRVPPGTVQKQKLRIRNYGIPDGDGARGDLYAVVAIQVPQSLDEAEKALWQQMADTSTFNPRT